MEFATLPNKGVSTVTVDSRDDWAEWQSVDDLDSIPPESPDDDIINGRIKSFSSVDDMLDSLKKSW
jgi:hypothetical protein